MRILVPEKKHAAQNRKLLRGGLAVVHTYSLFMDLRSTLYDDTYTSLEIQNNLSPKTEKLYIQ